MGQSSALNLTRYESLAQEHGVGSFRGLGWSSKEVQELRFKVLLEGIKGIFMGGKHSMLDVGCGVGDIIETPSFNRLISTYTGVDFNIDNIEKAKVRWEKFNNLIFMPGDFLEDKGQTTPAYDVVVASGLMAFYSPYDIAVMVRKMWGLAKHMIAFNVLIPRTLTTFYDLITILDQAQIHKWTIRRDYLYEDVTVYGYKD